MKTHDVIIIGAGPAGLACGIRCAANGLSVAILEKNNSAGKKLLLAGGGRCNITHAGTNKSLIQHYGKNTNQVKPALYSFTNTDLVSFFETRSLKIVEAPDGKLFPESSRSIDVLNVLLNECSKNKVELFYNTAVTAVSATGDTFLIQTAAQEFVSKNVVIATGGMSYPITGSTGDGYAFAQQLGHTLTETAPALTSVNVKDFRFENCSGISFKDSSIGLFRDDKKIARLQGDVLITHKGLSGPGILDLSRNVRSGDIIKISLMPQVNREVLEDEFIYGTVEFGRIQVHNFMTRYDIPQRFITSILAAYRIPSDMQMANFDKKSRSKIISALCELPFTVDYLAGYGEAMVTRGGVSLDEVNMNTMESRKLRGLYFCGEVLDIDGDTGGYNLQFAFSSGVIAAKAILSKSNSTAQ